jgi:hypothetical protein
LKPTIAPVRFCPYHCPLNSFPKDIYRCPKDFDDCKCKDGYEESNYKDECIKEDNGNPTRSPLRSCAHTCPLNSYSKHVSRCPRDFNDCECKDGYDESDYKDECVKDDD